MKAAEFESIIDAAIYRLNHGGWLFVDDLGRAYWFDAHHYTATTVMLHPMTRGKSGTVSCDNRYIRAA